MSNHIITFVAPLRQVSLNGIVQLPQAESLQLPSRGQVAVTGLLNNTPFDTVLEPDGRSGHWVKIAPAVQEVIGLHDGTTVSLKLSPTKVWPEPEIPTDFAKALAAASPDVQEQWDDITPMARWEWVRWINETNNPDTRTRRVEVSISKLENGKRRPCCFNLASCTDPELAKSGKLVV